MHESVISTRNTPDITNLAFVTSSRSPFRPRRAPGVVRRPLPRLDDAEDYRNLLGDTRRMEGRLGSLDRALEGLRPAFVSPEHF